MPPLRRRVALLITILTLAASGPAWAHAEISPDEVPSDASERFTVSVPTEKDVPTTGVKIEVPDGFALSSAEPAPGWRVSQEEGASGETTAVSWSGGEIPVEESREFAFRARTPEDPGTFAWRVSQTYRDGSVVEWSGPPDSNEPAPTVSVIRGGEERQTDAHESHSGHRAEGERLAETGGTSPLLLYAIGGVLALMATRLVLRRL